LSGGVAGPGCVRRDWRNYEAGLSWPAGEGFIQDEGRVMMEYMKAAKEKNA
jgi:hypothetical protein